MGALLERLRANFVNQAQGSANPANHAIPAQNAGRSRPSISTISTISTISKGCVAKSEIEDADLPARVRNRFDAACRRLQINACPVMQQFDAWQYRADNLREMATWEELTIEAHCRVLADEARHGVKP